MPLLLKQGLCWAYEKYGGEAPPEIQTSYRAAQSSRTIRQPWVMAGSRPVPPWEWRKGKRGKSATAIYS